MSDAMNISMDHVNVPQDHIEYLREQFIAVVSTVGQDGSPHSATVFFWINDVVHTDFNLYFVTRRHTRKYKDIAQDPRVAVVVGANFEPVTVQIEGEAELVEAQDGYENMVDLAERLHAHPDLAQIYGGHFQPRNPFPQMEGEDFAFIRVRPAWVRMMRYDGGKGELVFEQVRP